MVKTSWRRDYTIKDVVDAQKRFKNLKEHIGAPPDGQVPLGDSGIYTSPNLQHGQPVSPFNCEEYPDSPYCGGNPWSKVPVGLKPEWGLNECGVWVELNPILGFTKLPPVSVGWRRPGKCREEPKPPQPAPPPEDESRAVSPLKLPKGIDPNVNVLVVLINNYLYQYDGTWGNRDSFGPTPPSYTIFTATTNLINTTYPAIDKRYFSYFPSPVTGQSTQVLTIGGAEIETNTAGRSQGWQYDHSTYPPTPVTYTNSSSTSGIYRAWITADHAFPQTSNWKRYIDRGTRLDTLKGKYYIINFHQGDFIGLNKSVLIYGKLSEIAKDWEGYVIDNQSYTKPGMFGGVLVGGYGASIYKEEWSVAYISIPDPSKYPPPPDQERKKRCCMKCCNDGGQNRRDQDLSEILRLLREIKKNIGVFPYNVQIFDADDNKVGIQKRNVGVKTVAEGGKLAISELQRTLKAIGIDHFPIYSPSSVVEDESNGLFGDIGDLKNKIFKQKIDSLAEFLVWRAKNDNEIFGTWQESITVQDSDPNVKGNQPKKVVLPNMAKSFREIILLLSVLIKSQGFSMDAILKMYIDVANTKVSASVTEAIVRDIQDYLDYPTVTKTLDVPLGISIPRDNDPTDDKEDIEKFLRNSIVKAMFDDFTGEGGASLHDMILVLLDAASRTIQKPHT